MPYKFVLASSHVDARRFLAALVTCVGGRCSLLCRRLPIGQTADTYPADGRYMNGLFWSSVHSGSPFHPSAIKLLSPYTLVRWPNSQAVHNSLLNHT